MVLSNRKIVILELIQVVDNINEQTLVLPT